MLIITSNPSSLEKQLLTYTHHGIIRFDGKGCYLDEDRTYYILLFQLMKLKM